MLDDLVQEVFFRVWKGLPNLKEASFFSTWLYRITWNVASDQRRQWARQAEQKQYQKTPTNLEIDAPDLIKLHYQDLVQQALQSLSLEHRAVLVLHDLEDIPQKEIGKILGIPQGTVKSRLFYARNAVRKYLTQQGASL
jgi:RNA polymerase sigma-70 factor (ECF subfamily)